MDNRDANFADYKRAEAKALAILAEMKGVSPKRVDIELALITAVFELHKGLLPPATIARIVQTHLETLVPFYEQSNQTPSS
jgi:response regulator RpfG family c-di-GMP phosphodiesterase